MLSQHFYFPQPVNDKEDHGYLGGKSRKRDQWTSQKITKEGVMLRKAKDEKVSKQEQATGSNTAEKSWMPE